MNIKNDLKYTKDHEWIKVLDNNTAIIGITDYAQNELGDIVFIEVEQEESFNKEDIFGTIEAVKTVSDLYMPISGNILEINETLEDDPSLVNTDPYGEGWIIKIEITNISEVDELMSSEEYEEMIN